MRPEKDLGRLAGQHIGQAFGLALEAGMSPDQAALLIIRAAQTLADETNDRDRLAKANAKADDDPDDWCDLTDGQAPYGVPYQG